MSTLLLGTNITKAQLEATMKKPNEERTTEDYDIRIEGLRHFAYVFEQIHKEKTKNKQIE